MAGITCAIQISSRRKKSSSAAARQSLRPARTISSASSAMVFPGHAYVIQMIDGEAYIKYIDPGKDEEHWLLRSENEKYKPKQFHLSKIHKVYIIKAVITKSTLL